MTVSVVTVAPLGARMLDMRKSLDGPAEKESFPCRNAARLHASLLV
jgi:hypothetical protein